MNNNNFFNFFETNKVPFLQSATRMSIILGAYLHAVQMLVLAYLNNVAYTIIVFCISCILIFAEKFWYDKYSHIILPIVHLEILLNVTIFIMLYGWGNGAEYVMLFIISFLFFSPYKNEKASMLLSTIESVVMIILFVVYEYFKVPPLLFYIPFTDVLALSFFIMVLVMILFLSYKLKIPQNLTRLYNDNIILEDLANKDEITGINNRRYTEDYLIKMWDEYEINRFPFAIIIASLDIYDPELNTFVPALNEMTVRSSADLVKNSFRWDDYVGMWHSNEFIIVLKNPSSASLITLMKRIRSVVESKQHNVGYVNNLRVNFGCCFSSENMTDINQAIGAADKMLSKSKTTVDNSINICFQFDLL